MQYRPYRHVEVPHSDLLSWIFGNEDIHDLDRPLYIDALTPSRTLSYRQARTAVRLMIKGLKSIGVIKGTTVCLHAFNIYYPLIFLAVIGSGAVFVGSNPGYKEIEFRNLLDISNASFIITTPDLLNTVTAVTASLKIPSSTLLIFAEDHDMPPGFRSWKELFAQGEDDWVRFDDERTARETPACLVTTSGTTGLPKMAVLSHHAWVALNCVIDDPEPKPYEIKRLIFLPMFHTFAAPLSHLAPLREGHVTYVMPRFSIPHFTNALEKFDINEILLVPPMIVTFVSSAKAGGLLRNIRFVWCGGAPLDAAIVKKMYNLLAQDSCIAQVYGMTEAGWISTLKWPERDDSGSVGKLLPNVQAKLVDEHGNLIEKAGIRGEICVYGPRLMNGYLGNPEASIEAFVDGWLKTGDVGTIDKQGRMFIVDRQKDLIKVRGWQVSPAEIEGILRTHPKIVDAAVVGVKHANFEAPKAYIVRNCSSLTEDTVKNHIASLLVGYKHLHGGVCFVDSIPKSPSGKILKKLL